MHPPPPLPLHNLGPLQSPLAVGDRVGAATVVQIAEGGSHGVAVLSDGSVRCWGDQSSGKCRVPHSLEGVVAVAASDRHTLALQADGRVRAWGGMSLAKSALPRRAGRAVEIRAGSSDRGCWSAARLDNGRVRIWGYGACARSPWPIADEQRLDFVEWSVPHLTHQVAIDWLAQEKGRGIRDWSATSDDWIAVLADGRLIAKAERHAPSVKWPKDLSPLRSVALASGMAAAVRDDGQLRVWSLRRLRVVFVPDRRRRYTKVSPCRHCVVALDRQHRVSIIERDNRTWWCGFRVPDELQGRIADILAAPTGLWAVDVDGRLHGWGRLDQTNSVPFELGDEAWLEFATRMWGKTKQKIYPEHIRKSAAFKAIRTMHKVAEE